MSKYILSAGLACLIAAIVGGGLKAFGIEIPSLTSIRREVALGLLGSVLTAIALVIGDEVPPSPKANDNQQPVFVVPYQEQPHRPSESGTPDASQLTIELEQNRTRIKELQAGLAEHASSIPDLEQDIALQEQRILNGEGDPEARAKAQAKNERAREIIRQARNTDARAREAIGRLSQRNSEIERQLNLK